MSGLVAINHKVYVFQIIQTGIILLFGLIGMGSFLVFNPLFVIMCLMTGYIVSLAFLIICMMLPITGASTKWLFKEL